MKKLLILGLVVLSAITVRAQDEEPEKFLDFIMDYNIKEGEEWSLRTEAEWYLKISESGYNSISNDLRFENDLEPLAPMAGLYTGFVIQDEALNYVELTPWLGASLDIDLFEWLEIENATRVEFRNFFYINSGVGHALYGRLRDEVKAEIKLRKASETRGGWSLIPRVEFFFLHAPAYDEQFSNNKEFTIGFCHYFKNGRDLIINLRNSVYLLGNQMHAEEGYTFGLEYDF